MCVDVDELYEVVFIFFLCVLLQHCILYNEIIMWYFILVFESNVREVCWVTIYYGIA